MILRYTLIIILIRIGSMNLAHGQSAEDKLLIKQKLSKPHQGEHKSNHPLHHVVNPLYWAYKGTISFMDIHIADPMSYSCYFEHACGHFRKELSAELGPLRVALLTIDRQARCTRISVAESSIQNLTNRGKVKDNLQNYHLK